MRICFKNIEECNVEIEYKDKQVFVAMPFNPKEVFDAVYHEGIKKSFEMSTLKDLGWTCLRADEKIDIPESICRICKNIQESRLIIADVTGKNSNVFLEIGLSFGLEKPIMFLTQNIDDLPFDVRTFHAILYSIRDLEKLSNDIITYIGNLKPYRRFIDTLFNERWRELSRDKDIPQEPFMEILIGSTLEKRKWFEPNEENYRIASRTPPSLMIQEIIRDLDHFEYANNRYHMSFRIYYDGFFYYIAPLPFVEKNGQKIYYLNYLISQISDLILYTVAIMKRMGINHDQSIRMVLNRIRGLNVRFYYSNPTDDASFPKTINAISYNKSFILSQEWRSFYNIILEIVKEIFQDLETKHVITDEEIEAYLGFILRFIKNDNERDNYDLVPFDKIIPTNS